MQGFSAEKVLGNERYWLTSHHWFVQAKDELQVLQLDLRLELVKGKSGLEFAGESGLFLVDLLRKRDTKSVSPRL